MKSGFAPILAVVLTLAGSAVTGSPAARAADAPESEGYLAVLTVPGIDVARAAALRDGGIYSLIALSRSKPKDISRLLSIGTGEARRIIRAAKRRQVDLQRVYVRVRALNQPPPIIHDDLDATAAEAAFAQQISPTNECTLLVRKSCGVDALCEKSAACTQAKRLLGRYNASTRKSAIGESCLVLLAQDISYPYCVPD